MSEKAKKVKVPEDTPLIRQFFEVKAQYPEAMLLYRVGDFYETYGSETPEDYGDYYAWGEIIPYY